MKLSNVEVETQLLRRTCRRRQCDASQIQQVVLNLLLNAAEATQSKPERRVTVDTATGRRRAWCCTVADNGEGIAPENLAKIFDPFFTTKSEGKGVGLGLAVSYGIIQAHGGDIEVKSQLGEGTTFTVSLPLEAAGARERAAAAALWPGRNEVSATWARLPIVAPMPIGKRSPRCASRSASEFGHPVRELDLPGIDFAFDAAPRPVRLHSGARDARAAVPGRRCQAARRHRRAICSSPC